MTTATFPPDAAIVASFESILDQIDTARRLAEEKDEQAYWRTQHNGFAKAQANFLAGLRPLDTGVAYLVKSATRPDAVVHRVRQVGGVWLCSCEATGFCWHAALIGAIDHAADQAERSTNYTDALTAMNELMGV